MTENQQRKYAKLALLLSIQRVAKASEDDKNEQKEDKPREHFHDVNAQTKRNHAQKIEIEPIRFLPQDNVSDDEDVVYVRTDKITNTEPSQPTPFSSTNTRSVLQQGNVRSCNIQKTGIPKTPKLMPAYSKTNQKEEEPPKRITKKKVIPPSFKPHPMKCVSNAEREQIVAKYESGLEMKMISDMLNMPKHSVAHVLSKYKKTGEATIYGRFKDPQLPADVMLSIQLWLKDNCNVSLRQLVDMVWTTYSIRVSKDAMMHSLIGLNYFFNRVLPKHKDVNTSLVEMKDYVTIFSSVPKNVSKLGIIFLDVTVLNVTFKAYTKQRIQHKCFFIICALNETGVLHYLTQNTKIGNDAATEFVYDMKNKLRQLHIEESVVVVGNAANQRYGKLQDAIGYYKCNAMFLPANADNLNPVQYLFNNFKTIIKRANPQTIDELMKAVKSVPLLISENDCKNWFELMWSYIPQCVEEEKINDFD